MERILVGTIVNRSNVGTQLTTFDMCHVATVILSNLNATENLSRPITTSTDSIDGH